MPFRSEGEQLREQIRRSEERAADLLDERADLERHLAAQRPRRTWMIALLAGLVGGALLGSGAGALAASTRASRARANFERNADDDLDRERLRELECRQADERTLADLSGCQHGLAERAPSRPALIAPPCRCERGDPLCTCAFDRHAASSVLGAAQSPIARCFAPARTASFHTKLTFLPETGRADVATIDAGGADLSRTEHGCVVAVLRTVTVPRFDGAPVSVGKTYSVGGP